MNYKIQLDFKQQKDGSFMALKYLNTNLLGLVTFKVFKGYQYCNNIDNYFLTFQVLRKSYYLAEITEKELSVILTLLPKFE